METKFDGRGCRFTGIRRVWEKCQYWTRNMNDFGPRGYGVMDVLFCDASEEEKTTLWTTIPPRNREDCRTNVF